MKTKSTLQILNAELNTCKANAPREKVMVAGGWFIKETAEQTKKDLKEFKAFVKEKFKQQASDLVVYFGHSRQKAEAAALGADYATLSPIFATACKPGAVPLGMAALAAVCKESPLPIFALGGISRKRLDACIEAGSAGCCMMSELMRCICSIRAVPLGLEFLKVHGTIK